MKKENDWVEETTHLEQCYNIINKNVMVYETELSKLQTQLQETHQALNSGDTELYNQLLTVSSLVANTQNTLRKNKAALSKPFFGRIDYKDVKRNELQKIYIGKNGVFKSKTDVLIADWRAPISNVYYENELGQGDYQLPDESKVSIDLFLKRTYTLEGKTLLGYYDSDVASNDTLLVEYLSKNKDVVLGEIIATIQKEQNAIIRESPFANLIVQGVAGSGKTTVAMHRISYILYNYKHRFQSNEFCVIGSNDLLLNYITSGLPELDVPDIKHLRMDQLFIKLCEKDWRKSNKIIPNNENSRLRASLNFIKELDLFLMYLKEEIITCKPLRDPSLGIILSHTSNLTLLRENPHVSIYGLLTMLDERVSTRIQFLMSDMDKDRITKRKKVYAKYYRNKKPVASIYQLYEEFLIQYGNRHPISIDQHLSALARKEYDIYDLSALALIHYRVTQKTPNEEFGLLFLDEAQDFGISAYYVLKTILPSTYFTIMGDVSQNINYFTGLNDWYELQQLFLTKPKDKFMLLQKSYRNTIEISEYAGNILEKASFGKYKITPVIRHGIPVNEQSFWSDVEMAEYTSSLIYEIEKKGYTTTAIICNDDLQVIKAKEILSLYLSLTDGETENFSKGTMVLPIHLVKGLEFDSVILWNLDMKHGMEKPETAKLLYVACTRALHELHILNT